MRLRLEKWISPMSPLLIVTDDDGILRAVEFGDYGSRMDRLLRAHYEHVSVEHQHPITSPRHQHWRGGGVWLRAGARYGMVLDFLNEGLQMHLVSRPRHAAHLLVR